MKKLIPLLLLVVLLFVTDQLYNPREIARYHAFLGRNRNESTCAVRRRDGGLRDNDKILGLQSGGWYARPCLLTR